MFSRFFIERPIFAAVIAILICLAGVVAMTVLPPTIAWRGGTEGELELLDQTRLPQERAVLHVTTTAW